MFNIDNTLSEYGLTPETYEELLKDCSDKVAKISDLDWSEIAEKYNIDWNGDSLRKSSQPPLTGGAFVRQYYEEKYSRASAIDEDEYLKKLQIEKDEIYKAKRQLYDQRREKNKILTNDSRSEHLMEELLKCAQQLNHEKSLDFGNYVRHISNKVGCLFWADWHYGMTTDNIWNTYNTKICRLRVKEMVAKTIEYIELFDISTLKIILLGDAAHGSIHVGCRVASEEETCDQIMHVSELMAETIAELSKHVNIIEVYSCYGNHLRTIQEKNDSSHSDNMEKLIPWWLKARLQTNDRISIIESEFKEFTTVDVCGYNMVCVHGDLDNIKNIGVTINTLFSKLYGKTIDYVVSADKHHLEEFEQFDIESTIIRSLCGTDEYANNKRLYSMAGQTLMIFNEEEGRECIRNIKFKNNIK